jgi:hypothetical protein
VGVSILTLKWEYVYGGHCEMASEWECENFALIALAFQAMLHSNILVESQRECSPNLTIIGQVDVEIHWIKVG